jgi:hypothetical protein
VAGDDTITVIRPPARDNFGDPVPGTAIEFTLPGALFAPGPSREMGLGAAGTDTDATVYAPGGSPQVLATDQVRAQGKVYTVVGDPQDWGAEGLVIVLRKAG